MLLRHRSPEIDTAPVIPAAGLEHLEQRSIIVLRWLNTSRIDYVLVGPVARAIHGDQSGRGAVGIVPAPYLRNYERLAAALTEQGATLRSERGIRGADPRAEVRLDPDKLARGRRWLLHFAGFDLDVESSNLSAPVHSGRGPHEPGGPAGDGARYQELLYEATRVRIADGVTVEVASPEDLELYSHIRRTGVAPEFRITRGTGPGAAADRAAAPRRDS